MLVVKVPFKDAEKIKRELIAKKLLADDFNPLRDQVEKVIYFPVKKRFEIKYSFLEKELSKRPEKVQFRSALEALLSKEELEHLNTSMDVIGSIAILEIPRELEKKEHGIADALLISNKNIMTVLKKGKHGGVFRTQELKYLAGEDTKEALYRENGILLRLDVEKVYFSPRLSNERLRIVRLVKKNEKILVMFSGCAPYVCVLAKNTGAEHVDGIEINPVGHKYAVENLRLNKIRNAEVFLGDVKEVLPKLGRKYDRILMPLPKSADEYLAVALSAAKKGAVIHFYDFEAESESEKGIEKIRIACDGAGRKFSVLDIVKAGQHGPRAYRYCFDFKVE
jgi:tRNA (guanine37-N1)-methyltransferase